MYTGDKRGWLDQTHDYCDEFREITEIEENAGKEIPRTTGSRGNHKIRRIVYVNNTGPLKFRWLRPNGIEKETIYDAIPKYVLGRKDNRANTLYFARMYHCALVKKRMQADTIRDYPFDKGMKWRMRLSLTHR